jgi:phosphoribosylaminoimidazole-succinocarboxamide synthase
MRRSCLYLWLRVEGLPSQRFHLQHQAASGIARVRSPARTHLYSSCKDAGGHDENISFDDVVKTVGADNADALRRLTLEIFDNASRHAENRGLILADTKFEFGLIDGEIVLADEVLTPDSSRYWPANVYTPGGPQPSFDKQYVRDYLESIHWNKQAPAPGLPQDVVERTREKYLEAFRLISGRTTL